MFPKLEHKKTAKMMKRDLGEAGLLYKVERNQYRDFHQWRHLFITNAWSSGESPEVVRTLARHSDMNTTQGYSHTPNRQRHKAVNKMDELPLPE